MDAFTTPSLLLGATLGAISFILALVFYARQTSVKGKFRRLKAITGQSRAAIEAVVGPATSRRVLPNGKQLESWSDRSGRITLQFNGDICECITDPEAETG